MTASLRRIALLDGPEAGQEAIALSTGTGLDMWLLLGRGLDIGPLWLNGRLISWMHPAGLVAPHHVSNEEEGGTGIQRALGGMLVTCGLDWVRQPHQGDPLHGRHPFTPARLLECREGQNALIVEAETRSFHLDRGGWCLRRRIEVNLDESRFSVADTIKNLGYKPQELRVLYHWNCALSERSSPKLRLGPKASKPIQVGVAMHDLPTNSKVLLTGFAEDDPSFLHECDGNLGFIQTWREPQLDILAIEPTNCGRTKEGTSLAGQILEPAEEMSVRQSVSLKKSPLHEQS